MFQYRLLSGTRPKCDDKETLMNVINSMYAEFIKTNKKKWIILEGDQDTYNRLQLLKMEYGNGLSWMIPMPRDWHFLKELSGSIAENIL